MSELATPSCCAPAVKRPSLFQLVGLFSLVLFLGWLASRIGVLRSVSQVDARMTFASALLVGLVAASTSCVAVVGGLVLSYARGWKSAGSFAAGRVVSYGVFGAAIGALGHAVTPPPIVTGAIVVLAAVGMLVSGLKMLGLAPAWLVRLAPRLPQSFGRIVEGKGESFGPFLLGAATFFIPCGFTQAFQLYAFTTGDVARAAMLLSGFALGTAPALVALGAASGAASKNAEGFLMRFSATVVVVMGLLNVQNGFTIAGHPLRFPEPAPAAQAASDPNVVMEDGVQVIRMRIAAQPAYLPSDTFAVKAGVPVRMEIDGIGTGCRGVLQIPKLGASVALDKQMNVLAFTPKEPGAYVFSCAMGMYPGLINVSS